MAYEAMNIKGKIRRFVYEQHWTIGFIEQPLSDLVSGKPYEIHYVNGMPRDRWFADPFILDYNDSTISVLVEEFCYDIRRGRIAQLTIDRNTYDLVGYKIILDLPTHLSFPFIQRINNKIYICPENSESGGWDMYEYDLPTDVLSKVKTLATEPLTDAVVTDVFGEEMIFSTHLPTQNGNILSLYSAKGEFQQELVFPSKVARNAGGWFRVGDKVYRPAQDCNNGYGCAVIIQEVTKDGDSFAFTDVCRIISTNPQFTTGCHTLNNYKRLSVVDVHGWRRPKFVKWVNKIK